MRAWQVGMALFGCAVILPLSCTGVDQNVAAEALSWLNSHENGECACHFDELTESDGGGGPCDTNHTCPAVVPNCTGYAALHTWGKCNSEPRQTRARNSNWRESYADHTYEFTGDYDTQGMFALDGCVVGCDSEWLDDGECDETCNVPECNYDGANCPGGPNSSECYTRSDGADYRGLVQKTSGGLMCQLWSHQWPQTHTRTHASFPNAGLGGHSACRNPDGDSRAWCFTTDADIRWDYCDVGKPLPSCNSTLREPPPRNITTIDFNVMYAATARESEMQFFVVPAPRPVQRPQAHGRGRSR